MINVPPTAGTDHGPASAAELIRRSNGAKTHRVGELLATLAALGQARSVGGERFVERASESLQFV
jgi:hypothetical protein